MGQERYLAGGWGVGNGGESKLGRQLEAKKDTPPGSSSTHKELSHHSILTSKS